MSRVIAFTSPAWADYLYWQGQDKKTLKRINLLIDAARLARLTALASPSRCWAICLATGHGALMMFIDWFMPWTMWS